ncbi:VOC family protein [Paenarthrobacter sp. DKR-5]|nr:VOC family protein [Paenarthrobacter sp. DKR-5]
MPGGTLIKIAVTSVYVDDQEKAHRFYTDILGFETRQNIPLGAASWLTVGAAGGHDDVELLLEPGDSPIAQGYRQSLHAAGIPAIVLSVDDLRAEFERLTSLGVKFTQEPVEDGPVISAILDDTVGNLISLMQPVTR